MEREREKVSVKITAEGRVMLCSNWALLLLLVLLLHAVEYIQGDILTMEILVKWLEHWILLHFQRFLWLFKYFKVCECGSINSKPGQTIVSKKITHTKSNNKNNQTATLFCNFEITRMRGEKNETSSKHTGTDIERKVQTKANRISFHFIHRIQFEKRRQWKWKK